MFFYCYRPVGFKNVAHNYQQEHDAGDIVHPLVALFFHCQLVYLYLLVIYLYVFVFKVYGALRFQVGDLYVIGCIEDRILDGYKLLVIFKCAFIIPGQLFSLREVFGMILQVIKVACFAAHYQALIEIFNCLTQVGGLACGYEAAWFYFACSILCYSEVAKADVAYIHKRAALIAQLLIHFQRIKQVAQGLFIIALIKINKADIAYVVCNVVLIAYLPVYFQRFIVILHCLCEVIFGKVSAPYLPQVVRHLALVFEYFMYGQRLEIIVKCFFCLALHHIYPAYIQQIFGRFFFIPQLLILLQCSEPAVQCVGIISLYIIIGSQVRIYRSNLCPQF